MCLSSCNQDSDNHKKPIIYYTNIETAFRNNLDFNKPTLNTTEVKL